MPFGWPPFTQHTLQIRQIPPICSKLAHVYLLKNRSLMLSRTLPLFAAALLAGCVATAPLATQDRPAAVNTKISFLDIAKFDNDLSASLQAKTPEVEVLFYEKISPNNVPERLQKWISVVEADGGKVTVDAPPNATPTRGLFAVASLIGTLISSIKTYSQFNSERIYAAAKGRDAVVSLEKNSQGEVIVQSIKFVQRAP